MLNYFWDKNNIYDIYKEKSQKTHKKAIIHIPKLIHQI